MMNIEHGSNMSPFWNMRVRNISPYTPGEQPRRAGIIKLNTNENPYPPSPRAIEAIRAAADDKLRLYPDPACSAFRTAIAERYNVRMEQVFTGNGSDEVLAFAFGAFFHADSSAPPVLFPDMTYSFYPVYTNLWGIPFKEIPLDKDFSIDTDGYVAADCGGVVFPNPNAPTGIALPVKSVIKLAKRCADSGRVLIVDEAYQAFGAESAVPFIGEIPSLLTVHTLSKWAALAGLRAGFAIGQPHLIEALCRIRDSFNSYTMNTLSQAAAAAAVQDVSYYADTTQKIVKTRERTAVELAALGFTNLPSSANFIFTKPPAPVTALALFTALREAGILVRHFDTPRARAFLRVSIGLDPDMDRFLEECRRLVKY